ncbi:MAG: metallophosphoesterase [Saprospiraceae bacterium]|nr:metallophosphoesterase [Saprospiraceae bacterium]MCF8251691.1 metallophosphoesterase [Saprospiraceae bacterium]MCF8282036.1 metallophosphoesterase [Bacteroidales bacterium]MCF8311244.1 metallophosphoesterase [Saprospiraceae bacterium]MCF8442054.1 metallophosphoesterase [Saprospiraceae bacterium]
MKKRIIRYLKHIFATITVLLLVGIAILLSEDGAIHYGDNPLQMNWENDGPYVFFEGDSILKIQYIKGNHEDGFYADSKEYLADSIFNASCHFNLDNTEFNFSIDENQISIPASTYNVEGNIFAVSDIESSYRTFRDLLISSNVIDKNLTWSYGNGHLVLVGDFVDRGFSTTQVLWFIYKLEQEATKQGGKVHFILGNHELKNMQANYESSSPKYTHVAYILEKQQHELYNKNSFIGRWLASKNTMELINGHLFVHGGIHPEIANIDMDLDEMNETIRARYYQGYFPKKEKSDEQLLVSTDKGPSWYRGYFKDDNLTQAQVEEGLRKFNAQSVIVGHTIQSKVNKKWNGKVIGIDVQHPKDFHKNWPSRKSEALLIENGDIYRVLVNGKKIKM